MGSTAIRAGLAVILLSALGLVALLAGCVTPGAGKSEPRFAALVVGTSYQPTGNDAYYLNNTLNDANLVAGQFEKLNANFSTVTKLLDPDQEKFRKTLEEFGARLDKQTTAVFFFAGHAIQVDGHNYLLPSDLEGLIPAGAVVRYLQERSRGVIIVIDACRDNPLASLEPGEMNLTEVGVPGLATRGISLRQHATGTDGLAKMEITGARVMVVFATDPGDVALDALPGADNSPFSTAFAENILEKKSFEAVLADVSRELERYAEEVPGMKKQTPWRQSSWTEPLFLAGKPAAFSSTGVSMPPP